MEIRYISVIMGLFLLLSVTGCGKDRTYDTEQASTIYVTEADGVAEDGGESVKDSVSLYGTGESVTVSDEDFTTATGEFTGDAVADDTVIRDEIRNLRQMVMDGRYDNYYNSVTAFMKAYALPDTPAARELTLYAEDRISVKDIPTFIENGSWEYAYPLIESLRVPETYLRMIALTDRSYDFSHKDNSISLGGMIDISGVEVVDRDDGIYGEAMDMVDYPDVIYRFTIEHGGYTIYSYVASCKDKANRYLYSENADKSPVTPKEQEEGFRYDDTIEVIHPDGYDDGAWDLQTATEESTDETSEESPGDETGTEENEEDSGITETR